MVEQAPDSLNLPCFKEFLFEEESDDEDESVPQSSQPPVPLLQNAATLSNINELKIDRSQPRNSFQTLRNTTKPNREKKANIGRSMGSHRETIKIERRNSLVPSPFKRGTVVDPKLLEGLELELAEGDAVTVMSQNEDGSCIIYINGEYFTVPKVCLLFLVFLQGNNN